MKTLLLMCVLAVALVPLGLAAQAHYNVIALPALGGTSSQANSLNDRDWVTGVANMTGDTVGHAALWLSPAHAIDLGSLGGPSTNSAVAWPVKNDRGLVVGISDTNQDNPLGEAFSCWPFFTPGTPTLKICRGFRWRDGRMQALPPFPGGYNSYATAANNRGQIVGWAENGVHDPSCNPAYQILQFRAVIWQPDGKMQELPPLPGDSTSAATAINDEGEVVGISGACGIAVGGVSAAHAVLWEHGIPINLGDLGGHTWNTPTAINNHGVIVGFSLPASQEGTSNFEAVMWTKARGIRPLGMPAGDTQSEALGINERNQIVGLSKAPAGIRAILWEDGTFTDLNTLTRTGSPYLLYAGDINDAGHIAGQAFDANTGYTSAYIAIPGGHGREDMSGEPGGRSQPVAIPPTTESRAEQRAWRFGFDPTR